MIREKSATALPGLVMFLVFLAVEIFSIWYFANRAMAREWWTAGGAALLFLFGAWGFLGLTAVSPNESRVLQLFGSYIGTVHSAGFFWVNPFAYPGRRVSLRVRNFESAKLKVNDHDGNPIEIASIVVWRVTDTAEAVFQVDDYENFVKVQSEAAVRNLAMTYPYDAHQDGQLALRTSSQEIPSASRTRFRSASRQRGSK